MKSETPRTDKMNTLLLGRPLHEAYKEMTKFSGDMERQRDAYKKALEMAEDELMTVRAEIEKNSKLIESMKNCQNCGRGVGFCRHCKYAPDKRGWDDNWKEPI